MLGYSQRCWAAGFALLLAGSSPGAAQEKQDVDVYRAAIDARAAKAEKDKDVKALIECAFALYPLEIKAKVKEPRHQALLNQAADAILAKKDAAEAKRFLELAAPLAAGLPAAKREQISTLAVGKSTAAIVKEESERVRGAVKKFGPDLVDPEAKTRGALGRDLAEAVGTAVLACARPSSILDNTRMSSHRYSFPRANRATLHVEMRWCGAWTNNPYTSRIALTVEVHQGRAECLSLDYSDDCFIPPRPVHEVKETINALLR